MDSRDAKPSEHPKRRRRRLNRPPISAKFILDERVKGDVGIISQDLFTDFFGSACGPDEVRHIAIAPWKPYSPTLEEDCSWTVAPVKAQDTASQPSIVTFPESSLALQSFATALQASKNDSKNKEGIEVLVLDVEPLVLDTIFVKVDGEALRKHDEVQKKFGGGFLTTPQGAYSSKGKGKAQLVKSASLSASSETGMDKDLEERLRIAIRTSLSVPHIVHRNDQLPLPLPTHPITHAPFPPIQVTICEPVDQGLIRGETKIVIDMEYREHGHKLRQLPQSPTRSLQSMREEAAEDTSAEQFYSATESGAQTDNSLANGVDSTDEPMSTTDVSEVDDSSSDDDAENMISLNSPTLPTQASGLMSARTAATPRAFPSGARRSGIQSPGSVFSNYTATTARQGMMFGKQFQLKPLATKIPDSLLHPKPSSDEDDEARVFVDLKILVKLGCFSGDWVKLVATPRQIDGKDRLWPLGAFGDDEFENFRPVKIYGLSDTPDGSSIQYPKTDFARRFSNSFLPINRPKPVAYVSPILFSNLGQPLNVTLSMLSLTQGPDRRFSRSKLPGSAAPPIAKDITLLRIPTPRFTDRTSQGGSFANLKHHFSTRRRILRAGDLVAVKVDIGASKIFSDGGTSGEQDADLEELLASSKPSASAPERSVSVAWFKVGQLSGTVLDENQNIDPELWGGVTSVEPVVTRMAQAGSATTRVPSSLGVPWNMYLGAKRTPKPVTLANTVQTLDNFRKPHVSSMRRRIRELLAATTTPRAVHIGLKPMVILLHSTQRSIGKSYLVSAACSDLGLHIFPIDAYEVLTEGAAGGDAKTVGALEVKLDRAIGCGLEHTVPLIQHAEALTADRIAATLTKYLEELRALVITTTEIEKIPESIRSLVTHELEISAPDESEREGILNEVVNERSVRLSHDVDLAAVAVKTAALVAGDLSDVVERALVARKERLEALSETNKSVVTRDVLISGGSSARCVIKADFDIAVDAARKNFADSIGAPKIPNVGWDDVGGLTNVKDAVMETIQLPLERPELFAKGMKKRSGILFYGPPGTGKTLLAKAIATEFSLNFFSVKGPELLNMYIGESEANVRRVFQRARDARPCVVFFDELDSVAPKRGNQGDSGGVMDRIVSQLLAELDGMSDGDGGGGGVFVIGATNRPDLLDQALIRPGRFDKMLYLGVSDTHDKQLTILEALTRKFSLHPQMSLRTVAETLPFTYTGADLYALCSDAMLKAITRQASAVDDKIKALPNGPVTVASYFDHHAAPEDVAVMVTEEDFFAAQRELVGSVSAKELEHYQRVRQTFEGSSKPAQKSIQYATATVEDPAIFSPQSSSPQSPRKGKAPKTPVKGKAKAEDTSDDEDDGFVTSNDFSTPAAYSSTNGNAKGKGKAVAVGGFVDDGDEDLYGN